MKETLVIIPARGGSKGIKNKNIKLLNGKPLIDYSIDFALNFFEQKNICVSTDSDNIIELAAKKIVIPFKRPEALSNDLASTNDVINHAIDYYKRNTDLKFNKILLLQPTSPIRDKQDLIKLYKLYSKDVDMVLSVCKSKVTPDYGLYVESQNQFLSKTTSKKITRRQDSEAFFYANGSMYLIRYGEKKIKLSEIQRLKKLEMSLYYSVDIDEQYDWEIAEHLISNIIE